MTSRRRFVIGAAAAVAAPALLSRRGYAVEMKTVKIGSILAGTTAAGELMGKYLKDAGVTAEILYFPNITQRMQAVASGDCQIGYGGINAAMSMQIRGFDISLLANACDGGAYCVGKADLKNLEALKGKKLAVQAGTIAHANIIWKLRSLGLTKDVELVFMNINDMPIPMQRGDIDAMYAFEPYPSLARFNGWASDVWEPYDTPMGKTNLGFVASKEFIKKYPVLARECVKAHLLATRDLARDPAIAVETMVKTLNVAKGVADMAIKNTYFSGDSGDAFKKSVVAMGDMMLEAKILDKGPAWDKFFDTDLATI
jgi:ABC-type nitrate/sulfonate/bicarbonate transport system substrate-binding protein